MQIIPIKKKHIWLINIARSLKDTHQTGQVFITAFALKGNKILAIGCNNYKVNHPEKSFGKYLPCKHRLFDYHSGLHAEVKCIKELGAFRDDYHKIEIFVVRIGNDKNKPVIPMHVRCKCKYITIPNDNWKNNTGEIKSLEDIMESDDYGI